jgi:hypothetical protein
MKIDKINPKYPVVSMNNYGQIKNINLNCQVVYQ